MSDMMNVMVSEGRVFFQVSEDNREYYDLDAVERFHPDLIPEIRQNRIQLMRRFYQMREQISAYDGEEEDRHYERNIDEHVL